MEEVKKDKLKFKHKAGYALGDAGGCMTFALMGSTFSMYCTDTLKIDPILLGILLIIWNVWDFINYPLMGALMDKSFAKTGNPNDDILLKWEPCTNKKKVLHFNKNIELKRVKKSKLWINLFTKKAVGE